jgi:hypothetical protein
VTRLQAILIAIGAALALGGAGRGATFRPDSATRRASRALCPADARGRFVACASHEEVSAMKRMPNGNGGGGP